MSGDLLNIGQLQARLVEEFGEEYRYTPRAIRAWVKRPENPIPVARAAAGRRGYLFDWDEVRNWLAAEAGRQETADTGTVSSMADGIQVTLRALARASIQV